LSKEEHGHVSLQARFPISHTALTDTKVSCYKCFEKRNMSSLGEVHAF
jgi:hypothetical protein